MSYELSLKWGTLKTYDFTGCEPAIILLDEYDEIESSNGELKINQRQKEIVCELIDMCEDGTVYNHWEGRYVSNDEAKKYVMNYDNDVKPKLFQ